MGYSKPHISRSLWNAFSGVSDDSGVSIYWRAVVGHLFTHSGSPLHRLHTIAFSFNFIASNLHAFMHNPHAIHFCESMYFQPSDVVVIALVGHTSTGGHWAHW